MSVRARLVGRCIYCDGTDGLTREHVIPRGLMGNISPDAQHEALVLGKASCATCTPITRDLEGRVPRSDDGAFPSESGDEVEDPPR